MSKRLFTKPDSKEMVLNKCPICCGELEYIALNQYSDVYRILKNGKMSKTRKFKRDDGSMECGFLNCSCCDFCTDCDLHSDKYKNVYIYENVNGQFMYEIDIAD